MHCIQAWIFLSAGTLLPHKTQWSGSCIDRIQAWFDMQIPGSRASSVAYEDAVSHGFTPETTASLLDFDTPFASPTSPIAHQVPHPHLLYHKRRALLMINHSLRRQSKSLQGLTWLCRYPVIVIALKHSALVSDCGR